MPAGPNTYVYGGFEVRATHIPGLVCNVNTKYA